MTDTHYEPAHTGLLLMDPYNDFLSEGGSCGLWSKRSPRRSACSTTCAR